MTEPEKFHLVYFQPIETARYRVAADLEPVIQDRKKIQNTQSKSAAWHQPLGDSLRLLSINRQFSIDRKPQAIAWRLISRLAIACGYYPSIVNF